MTPQAENALRSVARECRKALIEAVKGKDAKERDAITTALLDQHAKKIACVPSSRFSAKSWLVYYVRLIDKEARGKA